ncbi:HNH endonuclease [Bacillus sp. AG4(2022)]|uniref:HNH endonuclease n=1 Tax=Bacillus sp. AG4(2022) TaxID=2962594 RepID=UPI00288201AA|nr:HNH endonuclease [Bacillus sp. AG4(2022)]MDT0160472.1 HNH endonuclease [Bacillus sp. AG4(2022)]
MSKLTKEEKEQRLAERRQRRYNETHQLINGIDHKVCSKCLKWMPCNEEYYYKNQSNGIDGFHPYCIQCAIKRTLEWEENNPEKLKVNRKRTDENRKEKHKLYRQTSKERGYQDWWRKNNPEKLKEYQRKRDKEKKHEISLEEWEDCKKYFNHRCAYCELKIEEHLIKFNKKFQLGDFHREHVVHNGANDLSNCVPACKTCNSHKRNYALEDWYSPDNENYEEDRLLKIHKWINEDHKLFIENKLIKIKGSNVT